jgi:hypothetical protein
MPTNANMLLSIKTLLKPAGFFPGSSTQPGQGSASSASDIPNSLKRWG